MSIKKRKKQNPQKTFPWSTKEEIILKAKNAAIKKGITSTSTLITLAVLEYIDNHGLE
jgi:hypothetical protein